jgi:hypothetical protein
LITLYIKSHFFSEIFLSQLFISYADLKIFDRIRNPFGAELIGDSRTAIGMEQYIDVPSDASLENVISDIVCPWIFISVQDDYKELSQQAKGIAVVFSTFSLCKSEFSAVAAIKSEY